ncbi:hypothetical protein Tsubulata_015213 [Turnera subulata]|uniref:Protein kinase domain-containing protein n=1 Tax=Turnera subulata TaxID=218843 RepID=A0A9Q0J3Q4_9ROSI|nr:hypothetical protein Tsubulata_015213 [Turnera subulata]
MKFLLGFLLLHVLPFWIFRFSLVAHSLEEGPLASPPASFLPVSPVETSMPAFSPGIGFQMGINEKHHHSVLHKKILFLFILACTLAVIILLSLFYCLFHYWRHSQKKRNSHCSDVEIGVSFTPFLGKFNSLRLISKRGSVPLVDYKALEKGTSNFGDDNLLGKGGFGLVYKAQLDEGACVAVKKLNCATEDAQREFENEVELLSKIRHPNIISVVGYSVHDEMGGLEYLHEFCKPAVIHRDLKSSNILLDSNFNAKLSDFGLAVADSSHNKNKLKLSGTVGYVAPEYMLDGELTDKSDVYAFGIVLLELLLGRRPVEKLAPAQCQSIVTWAMPQLTNRTLLPSIVDPVIRDTVDEKYLFQVAAVAVLCVQPEPSYRPLITDIVHSLIPLVPLELGGTLRAVQPATNGGRHMARRETF